MKILVDGIHLTRQAKGVGLYTRNVVDHLLRLDASLELAIVHLDNSQPPTLAADGRCRFLPVAWRNHLWHGFRTLPRMVAKVRPDAVWMPYETTLAKLPVPVVMICHDIPGEIRKAQKAGKVRPGEFPRAFADWLDDRLLARTLRRTELLCCNSRYVGNRVISDFGVRRQTIRLAPCAPGADFASLSRAVDIAAVRRRLELMEGYVLTFFTGDRRENPEVVPEVFRRLVTAGVPHGLVVAGLRAENRQEVEEWYSAWPWHTRVRFLPFYDAGELSRLVEIYTAASVYLDPSLHEGFGMQVIEAMACGTPVVCSDRGALPEVTAGAALLADPLDPEATAGQVLSVLNEPRRQEELAELGKEQARRFSWQRTAEVIHQGLQQAARTRA